MRKRRYAGGLNEALQVLRTQVSAAHAVQKRIPASTGSSAPAPTPAPPGIANLSSLSLLDGMSDEELSKLREEIIDARKKTEFEAQEWEELQKYLKSAMDAALMVSAYKADQPSSLNSKRRRVSSSALQHDAGESLKTDSEAVAHGSNAHASHASGAGASTSGPNDDDDEESDADDDYEDSADPEKQEFNADEEDFNSQTPVAPVIDHEESNAGMRSSRLGSSNSGLQTGRQVAFKVPQTQVDEWIQCEITKVFAGGQRFEVRDPEPDDLGNPGKTYQCRLRDIIPLPAPEQPIKPLHAGSVVLALYPETTAFYKAKVASYSAKRGLYYLRFEGEEDTDKEIEVGDHYVLPTRTRR